ncbi:hypothetical protein L1987_00931 [Smallanthus sonchifolius]|uniref:Uncharacterized protein n=1 Tax=Smallanthus sonchifolius TaxID=185202 RepID=A0ACB9K3Q5_9ASTR|nr:hypothetical protein L1987_00931 [Smallanthus sonchifolius]
MYTSGSTGKPKGVCGTEQGIYPLCGEETLLFKTSIGFIDHLQEILGALLTSCTLVIPSFSELKENLLSITEYLQDYSINRLVAVPSLMRILLPTLQSDCTYFDCKRLSSVIETESLSTVPIGIPIPNCDVMLVGENAPNYGEIYVSGLCIATGYFNHDIMPLNTVKKLPESSFCCSVNEKESQLYFKTGKINWILNAMGVANGSIGPFSAFCDALVVENINNNDDFFTMGGDSISAAHTCHKLGINMKLLYTFPTPLKLVTALLDPKIRVSTRLDMGASVGGPQLPKGTDLKTNKPHGRLSSKLGDPDAESENHPHKVVVGCYKGKIYFLNSLDGSIGWTFQTGGEVKSQPVVDRQRHLVWCGSYDHSLYALDYQSYCCDTGNLVWKHDLQDPITSLAYIDENLQDHSDRLMYVCSSSGSIIVLRIKLLDNSVEEFGRLDIGGEVLDDDDQGYNGNVHMPNGNS